MNEEYIQHIVNASVQARIQQALSELQGGRTSPTSDSSDVDSDAVFEESFEDGAEVPEEIFELFPDVPSKGRISKEAYKKILEQNPEPSRGILKPPKLDRYIQARLPQEAIKRDEVLMAMQADTGRIVRPTIAIMARIAPIDSGAHKKCKQSIILAINAFAKITVQRKASILRAIKMDEAGIKYWCQEHSTSREWLFGEKLQGELAAKKQERMQDTIEKIVSEKVRTSIRPNYSNASMPIQTFQSTGQQPGRGNYQHQGRGRGRGGSRYPRGQSNQQGRAGP